jgi:PKD repeat protein
MNSAHPRVMDNIIQYCTWFCFAGDENSSPIISRNIIRHNLNDGVVIGGYGQWTITDNVFEDIALSGVYAGNVPASGEISGNIFRNCGYGIYGAGTNFSISKNLISFCTNTGIISNGRITHNTIVHTNIGIDCSNPNVVVGNIIAYSSLLGISGSLGTTTFGFNDFYSNAQNFNGAPTGSGMKSIVNLNGDSTDLYFNLFEPPNFVDSALNDYHLALSSLLINAGNPSFPKDPDSTVADIGAYFFETVIPIGRFNASPRTGRAPLSVYFTNTSIGTIDSHFWSYGDGDTSTQGSPNHTYYSAGVYRVNYIAVNAFGADTTSDSIVVQTDIQKITSIEDIPNDQGGRVSITWMGHGYDGLIGNIVSAYVIYELVNDEWIALGSVPGLGAETYNFLAETISDSTSTSTAWALFKILAHCPDIGDFVSDVDSGYSVDNLPPSQVVGLSALAQGGTNVRLEWNANLADPDIARYEIYRSTVSGFVPSLNERIGVSLSTNFVDNSAVSGAPNYYRAIAVDVHDNRGIPSVDVAANVNLSLGCSMDQRWNLVSVPLTVSDHTKTTLFPTSVSNAFAYDEGYMAWGTLANGKGYWLKFDEAQQVQFSGLLRNSDTVNVLPGWNLVGSISEPVSTSAIGSIPPAIATSPFYGYNSGYIVVESIVPGKGYWVKVNQAGQLLVSSNIPLTSRIQIVPTSETPPAPPDEVMTGAGIMPTEFSLDQNYPNPFNPVTTIHYALPISGRVILRVYSVLGQEVATLVDEIQEAGFKSVEFDASQMTSGVYYYRIVAGEYNESKRMVLVK